MTEKDASFDGSSIVTTGRFAMEPSEPGAKETVWARLLGVSSSSKRS